MTVDEFKSQIELCLQTDVKAFGLVIVHENGNVGTMFDDDDSPFEMIGAIDFLKDRIKDTVGLEDD